jgi:hypothetical protein
MKYPYNNALVTMAAAITHACLQAIRNDNSVTALISRTSTPARLIITNLYKSNILGIKFDNISAGKYFALIHTLQQQTAMNKATEKSDRLIPAESLVTPKMNELVWILERNEPSV